MRRSKAKRERSYHMRGRTTRGTECAEKTVQARQPCICMIAARMEIVY